MAIIGQNALTLADWAKRVDPDGTVPIIVEILKQVNEILDDMLWVEGNLPTGHRTTIRTGLPAVVWRKLNYGVQPSKSTTKQVDDTCGMLEGLTQIDVDLMKLNGNDPAFRLSEELPFLEAMNQEFAGDFFYSDTQVNEEKFLGLAARYPSLATRNVINAGGTGSSCSSMWLIVWGPNTVHGIFPKGTKAGIIQEDLGIETVPDSQTPPGWYRAYRTRYQWKCGLCVRDWRYVVRIANIATSGTSGILDLDYLAQAYGKLPTRKITAGRPVFYCNQVVWTQLNILALNKSNMALRLGEYDNEPTLMFWDIPVRQVDQILNTETALS